MYKICRVLPFAPHTYQSKINRLVRKRYSPITYIAGKYFKTKRKTSLFTQLRPRKARKYNKANMKNPILYYLFVLFICCSIVVGISSNKLHTRFGTVLENNLKICENEEK